MITTTITNSSFLRSSTYDKDAKTLTLELINGKSYEYIHVTNAIHEAFLSAPSKGKFMNAVLNQMKQEDNKK